MNVQLFFRRSFKEKTEFKMEVKFVMGNDKSAFELFWLTK